MTAGARTGAPAAGGWRLTVVLLVGVTCVRLAFAALIPLFPDETYYWEWSRHLAAGYYDHPAGVAVLISGGTRLAAALGLALSPLAVRLVVVLTGFVTSLAVAGLARRLGGDPAALIAATVFCAMPLSAAGLVLATPDAPLLATTAVTMYCVVRAVECPARSVHSLVWWITGGLALGAAFASKYTSILTAAGVGLALVSRPTLRRRFGEAGPYAACVAAIVVFLPALLWNAQHHWISFAFQLHHGLGPAGGSFAKRELDLLGAQAGLATPILFVLLALSSWSAVRRPGSDAEYVLGVVTLACAGMFVVSALRRPVEANWPGLAYVSAVPLLAAPRSTPRSQRWMTWGIALAAVVSAVVYVQAVASILPLPARRDPIARSAGWDQLAGSVATARSRLAAEGVSVWVGADRYQEASELAFHLGDHPVTFSMNLSGRANQYDLWPGFPAIAHVGDDLILVLDEGSQPHPTAIRLRDHFRALERGALVALTRRDGDVAATRRLWVLSGWDGTWPGSVVAPGPAAVGAER